MRDPMRIYAFCDKLAELWRTYCPDWRFAQLMSNIFASIGNDPFYWEDDRMEQYLETYFTEMFGSRAGNEDMVNDDCDSCKI